MTSTVKSNFHDRRLASLTAEWSETTKLQKRREGIDDMKKGGDDACRGDVHRLYGIL